MVFSTHPIIVTLEQGHDYKDQPMRDALQCNVVSHWLSPYPKSNPWIIASTGFTSMDTNIFGYWNMSLEIPTVLWSCLFMKYEYDMVFFQRRPFVCWGCGTYYSLREIGIIIAIIFQCWLDQKICYISTELAVFNPIVLSSWLSYL